MNSPGFPSRFLKKLNIFQQIKIGNGFAKHKRLWQQEAAILKWSYGPAHQHLKSWIKYDRAKRIIASQLRIAKDDVIHPQHTIGNLLFKEFIDVTKSENGPKINPKKIQFNEEKIKDYYLRPTLKGLEVGEVLTEIYHNNLLIKIYYNCKYWVAYTSIWVVLMGGMAIIIANAIKELSYWL